MAATTFYVYVIACLNPIFSRGGGGGRGGMENLKFHFHFKNLNASNKDMCCLKFLKAKNKLPIFIQFKYNPPVVSGHISFQTFHTTGN